jgi:hypothetical protein
MSKSPGQKLFEAVRDEVGSNAAIYPDWESTPQYLRLKWESAALMFCAKDA